jgi:hypothetical protein
MQVTGGGVGGVVGTTDTTIELAEAEEETFGLFFFTTISRVNPPGYPVIEETTPDGYRFLGALTPSAPGVYVLGGGGTQPLYLSLAVYALRTGKRTDPWAFPTVPPLIADIPLTWSGIDRQACRVTAVTYTGLPDPDRALVDFAMVDLGVAASPRAAATGPVSGVGGAFWSGSAFVGFDGSTDVPAGETLIGRSLTTGGDDWTLDYFGSADPVAGTVSRSTTINAGPKWTDPAPLTAPYYTSGSAFAVSWAIRSAFPPRRQRQRNDGLTSSSVPRASQAMSTRQGSNRQKAYW